jgi:hypothetical protein
MTEYCTSRHLFYLQTVFTTISQLSKNILYIFNIQAGFTAVSLHISRLTITPIFILYVKYNSVIPSLVSVSYMVAYTVSILYFRLSICCVDMSTNKCSYLWSHFTPVSLNTSYLAGICFVSYSLNHLSVLFTDNIIFFTFFKYYRIFLTCIAAYFTPNCIFVTCVVAYLKYSRKFLTCMAAYSPLNANFSPLQQLSPPTAYIHLHGSIFTPCCIFLACMAAYFTNLRRISHLHCRIFHRLVHISLLRGRIFCTFLHIFYLHGCIFHSLPCRRCDIIFFIFLHIPYPYIHTLLQSSHLYGGIFHLLLHKITCSSIFHTLLFISCLRGGIFHTYLHISNLQYSLFTLSAYLSVA